MSGMPALGIGCLLTLFLAPSLHARWTDATAESRSPSRHSPVLIANGTGASATPQHPTELSAAPTTPGGPLSLTIDGARTPELVPDDVAYRHLISAVAVSASPSTLELSRQTAMFEVMGLSASDRTAFIANTVTVRDALHSLDQTLRDGHHDLRTAEHLRRQRLLVLDTATARVLSALSPSGVLLLKAHVANRVKSRIRIYSDVK
jgi:hypothetical protein